MELEDYAKSTREELVERIERGKREKDIIILAHNYTRPEVQKVADIIGDSLALSREAAAAPNSIILFAGVMFMAETAKILAPEKTVIVPDPQAGCPLAASATFEDVLKAKEMHPEAVSVAYVNTSAEVKAAVDTCCTSANAVEIVRSIPQKEILFLPDRNLGSYTAQQNPDKKLILWAGADNTASDRYGTSESSIFISTTGWKSWDLTSAIQDYVDGTSDNYGFIIIGPTSGHNRAIFKSSECDEFKWKPELVVKWTP